jgi:hypothetical protein
MLTASVDTSWWQQEPRYLQSLFLLRDKIPRFYEQQLKKFPRQQDHINLLLKPVICPKLYEMSRHCYLPLYQQLVLKTNVDAANQVLQYVFGSLQRWSRSDGDGGQLMEVAGGNILSETDFDTFLRHEMGCCDLSV